MLYIVGFVILSVMIGIHGIYHMRRKTPYFSYGDISRKISA